jgi:hypothetical protein
VNLLRVKKGYPIELSNCTQNRRFSAKYVSRPILLGGETIRLTKQIVPTANLGSNSVGCCLQRWLKIGGVRWQNWFIIKLVFILQPRLPQTEPSGGGTFTGVMPKRI